MKKTTAKQVLTKIKEYLLVAFAGSLNAISIAVLVNPAKLVAGGVSGLSSALAYVFELFIDGVPFETMVSILYFAMNLPLLIAALILLRGDFTYKTVWSTVICTLVLRLVPSNIQFNDSKLICVIFGGILIGISMYLAAINNGSNAGTEIIARLVHKYRPEIDLSKVILIANFAITGLGSIVLMVLEGEQIWVVLYSLMYVLTGSKVMGMLMRGLDHPQKFLIVSANPDELAQAITDQFKRGLSCLEVVDRKIDGKSRKMIAVIVQYRQAARLKQLIKQYDPAAFTIVKDVYDVFSRPLFNRSYK